ncbi:MAG: hypothetical protein JRJ46_06590 [Deltaproteobacteria bacterium]|nr:hypothetical protein [Deltaproteobacteria bacterium]
MIIGILAAITFLFGGGIFTFDYARDAAEEFIKDKDRAKQVISITKQADEAFEEFAENLDKLSKQLPQMNKDYNLTREQMDAFSSKVKKNRTAFLEKFVELRFQISKLVTAEEWQAGKQVQRE